MNTSILINPLDENNYSDYIERIINIFRLSSKDSSIMLRIKISDGNCNLNLSIIDKEGQSQKFSDDTFKCDEVFYSNFLDSLVNKVYENCEIVTTDVVNLDNDEFVAFRMITENNDLLTIDGISQDYSMHLIEICSKEQDDEVSNDYESMLNNEGFSNISMFTLIILVLILILLVIYLIIFL